MGTIWYELYIVKHEYFQTKALYIFKRGKLHVYCRCVQTTYIFLDTNHQYTTNFLNQASNL